MDVSVEGRLFFFLYRANLKADHALCLRNMTKAIEICSLPIPLQEQKWNQLEGEIRSAPFSEMLLNGRLLTRLLIPVMGYMISAHHRDLAIFRCAIVLLAIEQYRLTHHKWPGKLEELCPAFLNEVPKDPYDDQPVKYRIQEEGVTIYTCGADRVDDGGMKLVNVRTTSPGSDVGLRLWNANKRGLPPPKDEELDDPPFPKEP